MKPILFILCLLFLSLKSYSQADTIYKNGEKIIASVKEITEDAIKFSYPNEDLVNSIYKNSIQKIVFKSGRIQIFSEATSFKTINSVEDYENVTITGVEGEIKGLYKIGDVSAKAKGTTTLSNQERVKQRAYRKLKIQAAMAGANIVYLSNQRTEGNKMGGYFQSGSTAETNLSGVAYSNILPDHEEFKKAIGTNSIFTAIERYKLWSSDSDVSKEGYTNQFSISNIINENGITIIEGTLEGEKKYNSFKLTNFDESGFNIFYNSKSTAYNIRVSF